MLVGMWMSRDIVTVEPSDTLADAAQLMARHRIRHLPVTDADGRLVGILSATDAFHAVPLRVNPFAAVGMDEAWNGDQRLPRVADVMSTNLATTTADSPVECAAATMHDRKVGALPVVHGGKLAGLITESDILRAFTEILAVRGKGARITFDVAHGEDMAPLLADLVRKHQLRLINLISLQGQQRSCCVVRIAGVAIDALLEDLWQSGHRVQSVVRS